MKALPSHKGWRDASFAFWLLVAFLGLTFFTGGSARADVQSLILLRPISILVCGIALWNIRWSHFQSHRFISLSMLSAFALTSAHLIPLPPSTWILLPDRQIQNDVEMIGDMTTAWRPLTFTPDATLNSLLSLATLLAIFLLGMQISRNELTQLLKVCILLSFTSIILGLLQIIGNREGPLYLYEITNNGSAVGFFANRNHQALLLAMMFPMLGVYASTTTRFTDETQLKRSILIAVTVILIPLLLITGSRAGLLAGACGFIFMWLIYRSTNKSFAIKKNNKKFEIRYIFVPLVLLSILLTFLMSRAESFYRFSESGRADGYRLNIWKPVLNLAEKQFPFGSGIGSFSTLYKSKENDILLSEYYFNQVHNDFLDIFLTGSLVGLALVALAFFGWSKAVLALNRRRHGSDTEIALGKLGVVCAGLMVGCSIVDYPLRTPIFGALLVICSLWAQTGMQRAGQRPTQSLDDRQASVATL